MKRPRTIFIGDVHGCLDELQALLKKCNLSQEDRVILTGDLINRGPDPVGVVSLVQERGFDSVMGNHEADYLAKCKTKERYSRLRAELGALHTFLEGLPLFIRTEGHLVVHAGVMPDRAVEETPPHVLLHIRTWDGQGKILEHPDHPPWHQHTLGPERIVYGHWARQGLHVRPHSLGLDSGCVYGRQLSAYILEEDRIVQVEARRQYYVPPQLRP